MTGWEKIADAIDAFRTSLFEDNRAVVEEKLVALRALLPSNVRVGYLGYEMYTAIQTEMDGDILYDAPCLALLACSDYVYQILPDRNVYIWKSRHHNFKSEAERWMH